MDTVRDPNTWCLIESNPCIFYDMLQKMGASGLSVEDILSLDVFDEYRDNRDKIQVSHILGMEEYKGESAKRIMKEQEKGESKNGEIMTCTNKLYKVMDLERKYNTLLKNNEHIYGIIFLFNIDENYKTNKFVEHTVPPNLFFAKQMIPNACATQAVLSIVLNKEIELREEIKNIKTFTEHFDYTMKGVTLTNCDCLRQIHNSYKPMTYVDDEWKTPLTNSDSNFHFVSYIQFDECVYLLDGLQEGPVLIKSSKEEMKEDWIGITIEHIKNEMNAISNTEHQGKDIQFNILAITKDKEILIQRYMLLHRLIKLRASAKLMSYGVTVESNKDLEEDCEDPELSDMSLLPDDVNELQAIILNATKEIQYLENLLDQEKKVKSNWKRELDFKYFNFCPFIISSLKLMSKYNMLNENYKQAEEKKKNKSNN